MPWHSIQFQQPILPFVSNHCHTEFFIKRKIKLCSSYTKMQDLNIANDAYELLTI